MKVIDLLNKIANGEDVPMKVKVTTGPLKDEFRIWKYNNFCYEYENGEDVYVPLYGIDLNDKVEIIEEDKKINKDIKWYFIEFQEEEEEKIAQVNMNFKLLREKMTELIDAVNELKEEK